MVHIFSLAYPVLCDSKNEEPREIAFKGSKVIFLEKRIKTRIRDIYLYFSKKLIFYTQTKLSLNQVGEDFVVFEIL